MFINRRITHSLLLSFFCFVLVGCGESTLTGSSSNPSFDDNRPAYDPLEESGDPTPEGEEPTGEEASTSGCCVLIPATGESEQTVNIEGSLELGVYLFSLSTGEPLSGELINWNLEEGPDSDSFLSASSSLTDANGLAEIRFNAGWFTGEFTLSASHVESNEVSYTITVDSLPMGGLEVEVSHPSEDIYDVSPITIRLYEPEVMQCSHLSPSEYPAAYTIQGELDSTDELLLIEDLMAGESYTVLATGFGALGEIAAQGCQDDVLVQADEIRQVNIILQLLPLNPVGEYEVNSYWDFTDALLDTGAVGEIIVDILDLFENPGEQLLDYMLDAVGYFVGSWVSDIVDVFLSLTGLDDLIADSINSAINSSDTLTMLFSLGCDLRRVVTDLQINSIMSVGKLDSEYELFGIDNWTGLGVCDFTPDPDFVVGECDEGPECERVEIPLGDEELGLMRAEWTGRVLSYDHLDIDLHPVDFNYGGLILFVLENLLFPAITGDSPPVTLDDVFFAIVDCEGFAYSITGDDGEICVIDCIEAEDLEDFCSGAISLVFGTVFETFVSALSFDSVIEKRGSCTLYNNDIDLEVEQLVDGEYTGTISVVSESSFFESSFTGDRLE